MLMPEAAIRNARELIKAENVRPLAGASLRLKSPS